MSWETIMFWWVLAIIFIPAVLIAVGVVVFIQLFERFWGDK